jgi:mono/diheme cytochrome c family protein
MIVVRILTRTAVATCLAAGLVTMAACDSDESQAAATSTTTQSAAKSGASPAKAVSIDHGRDLYKVNCTPCHGEQGKGDGPAAAAYNPKPRNHTDAAYMSKLTDEDIAKVIQYGGAMKGMPMMPSNPVLKGTDLAAVVAYTRSLSAHGSSAGGAR